MIEILDIMAGFAFCSNRGKAGPTPVAWERTLQTKLRDELPRFQDLAQNDNETIVYFAEMIIENIA